MYTASPSKGGLIDLPAVLIALALTALLCYGMKESARLNNLIVSLKIFVILLFVFLGFSHIDFANYTPFAPYGWQGIFTGTTLIFFSYIGFDAISTAAEEAENPKRDMPVGLLTCLAVVSILYAAVAFVLTGVIPYNEIISENAVPGALARIGINWGSALVGIGAIIGMVSTLLVMLYGQVRIFMAMSRDGLLPKLFSEIHPRYKTPYLATIITGSAAGLIAGLLPLDIIIQFLSIGTLLSFILVSWGVILLRKTMPDMPRVFKTPGVPYTPLITVLGCLILLSRMHLQTWIGFGVWLTVGLLVYWLYGSKNSVLQKV
jgi:APA family basic amino acid/polyamine antiporter